MIRTKNLCKMFNVSQYKEIMAVDSVNFEVKKGEVFGLVGPNGAGKTTLLRMLATLLTPTSGEAWISDFNIQKNPLEVKKSIGFLSGNTRLYNKMTPRELLVYFGKLYDMENKEIKNNMEKIVDLLNLSEFIDKSIEKLSTGQTQRTSIARSIFHNPQIYIFDEPTLGLDIFSAKTIIDFVNEESKKDKTIIFSTHYMAEIETICTKVAFIYEGKICKNDSLEKIREEYNNKNLYDVFLDVVSNF